MTYELEKSSAILSRCAELLSESGIASAETVEVVCGINGMSFGTLDDILYHKTGERDVRDYFEKELVSEGLAKDDDDGDGDEEDRENE